MNGSALGLGRLGHQERRLAPTRRLAAWPRNGGAMFRYRLHLEDGSDAGEATYAQMIHPCDEIHLGAGQRFRVLDVAPFEVEDESPFVGLLQVETE
jgi:hypothetical protein